MRGRTVEDEGAVVLARANGKIRKVRVKVNSQETILGQATWQVD